MPDHRTFFAPQVEVRHDLDTGERFIELDFRGSICNGIPAYTQDPTAAEATAEWLDRVTSVQGTFYPTSVESVVRLVPGELPCEDAS